MASSKKVGWAQLKVGILTSVSLVIFVVLVFLMTGANNPFSDKFVVYTFFSDSAAMTEGSVVRLNGILVGKVQRIELTGSSNAGRAIRMTLEIEKRFLSNIPKDSEVAFSAENVLGTKYLNIQRGQSPEPIRPDAEMKSRDDKDFMAMLSSAYPLLDSMQAILTRVDRIVAQLESGQGSIGKLLYDQEFYNRANSILQDFQKVTHALASGEGTIGALLYDESLYSDIRGTVKRLDTMVAGLQQGEGTAGKLLKDPALYDELKQSSSQLRVLVTNLNAGKGTVGKFLTDDTAHAKLMATLDTFNTTLDKVNSGQGTIGQLMVNRALFDNLVGTSGEMQGLMKDFRANPKKFLSIKLHIF